MGSKKTGSPRKPAFVEPELFVGRQAELAQLSQLLEKARSGQAQLAAISGEAGIGKTSLARAAAAMGTAKGFSVHWVRCHEGDYVPSYWPWKQILLGLLELCSRSTDAPAGKRYAETLAAVIPEARQLALVTSIVPPVSPEMERMRVMEAAVGLVKTVAAAKPLLVILDNLHCADGPSLRLLEFLTHEMADWKVMVIVTYREPAATGSGPFWETLGALAGEAGFTGMTLTGLDHAAIGQYLRGCMTIEPPSDLIEAVLERTEGNALFVSEVSLLLARKAQETRARQGTEPRGRSAFPRSCGWLSSAGCSTYPCPASRCWPPRP
jgi:predicted ATPase